MTEQTEQDIQELVRRAQHGENDSLGALFEIFADRIFRFVRFRVQDTATAEDLAQTVFLEMIRSLPRYRTQKNAKFSTWLFQIARFRVIDYYRARRPILSLDQDVPDTAHPPSPTMDEDAALVDMVLTKLSERHQTVLHLSYREDLDDHEIAHIMKISSLNVRVLRHRALAAARKILQANPPDHEKD